MNNSVRERILSEEYRKGQIYELRRDLAVEYIRRGWATPLNESAAVAPAQRTATRERVCKR